MEKSSKIYVAGHTGLVGSAIIRELKRQGYYNLCIVSHKELDLRNQKDTEDFFEREKPEYVFLAAAVVGGVLINDMLPGKFLYDNLAISMNVIHTAYKFGIKKLLYMGSGCVYPKLTDQPIREESLLTGDLEKTNEAYAVAKIAGIKMCEYYNKQYGMNFISCMPCNAYGPGDNFDLNSSHVVPALIRKAHEAKMQNADSIVMWGTGNPVREFIYIDDIANACVFLMNHYIGNTCINIGTGTEFTIRDLTEIVCDVVGFQGTIVNDLTKPDGSPRKLLDSSKIFTLGWRPSVNFSEGIQRTYQDFLEHEEQYLN
ncbi:MAG: GDP-L-fucose synthase [Lachnospiraceae bacterium]|nr:GDP-L-fucose synthase [Lachnospiraceae bacterium]